MGLRLVERMNDERGKFCVYAIQSEVVNRVYVGHTDNLERRFKEHNDGRVKSTKADIPWKILTIEYFNSRSQARWCENSLKKSKGKRLKWLANKRI